MPSTETIVALREKVNERKAFEWNCRRKTEEATLLLENAERRLERAEQYRLVAEMDLSEAINGKPYGTLEEAVKQLQKLLGRS